MYRIRIRKAPSMQTGGSPMGNQRGFGLQLPVAGLSSNSSPGAGGNSVRSFLPPVDRSVANIEAERGETVWGDFDGDRFAEHYKIGGERHSRGGTPLQVPEGSFVFSDTKKLKIGGAVLKEFGKSPDSKKKYTFAQLAKQYDLNTFKVLLEDEQSDRMEKDTAQLMLDNYQRKLAKLALLQEGMKGFPQGIPSIAAPLLTNGEEPGMPEVSMGEPAIAQYGGYWARPHNGSSNAPKPWEYSTYTTQNIPVRGYWARPHDDSPNAPKPWELPPSTSEYNRPDRGYWLRPHDGSLNSPKPWELPPPFDQYVREPAPFNQYGLDTSPEPDINPSYFPDAGRIPKSARKDAKGGKQQAAEDARTRRLYEYGFNPITDGNTVYPGYISKEQNADVPWTQHQRADGTYGTRDWDMNDFYQRHPWVKQEHPGFDSRNEKDVKWFQNAYNDRYRDLWGYNYFNGKGHLKTDGKFGQGTYSTPGITEGTAPPQGGSTTTPNAGKPAQDKTKEEQMKQDNSIYPNSFDPSSQPGQNEWMPWWAQDQINYGAAYRNRHGLHKYMPTYVSPDAVLPNAVYYDPTRALASNQEAMAAQNMLSGLYAGPQRLRAVGSNIQGQGAGLAANVLGDYNNRNVAVANQLAGIRAEIRNNIGLQKTKAIEDFLAKNTIANQQYDNAVRLADNDVRTNLLSGITNAQKTYWLNRLNPYYNINPESGALNFKRGKSFNQGSAFSAAAGDSLALYKANVDKFRKAFPDADINKALEYAQRNQPDNDAGLSNPMLMSMLQQYG